MFEAVFLYGNQYNHYVLDDAHDVLEVMGIDPTHRDYSHIHYVIQNTLILR